MKRLPIGIQSIEKILGGNYVYVDKTPLIYQLITNAGNYFLSRPRRFGKSLLVSTLKAIFNGEKELFKDCKIAALDYQWQKHPIIHLDFAQIPTDSTDNLETALREILDYIAESYQVTIKGSSLQLRLGSLVRELSKQNQVVVLVDEYDKPLIDNMSQIDVAKKNRKLIRNFFGTLKGLDRHLRFVFVTGVSKFSQVSLFSGLNHLNDLTIHPNYATLLGYTEEEITLSFKEHIEQIAQKQDKTFQNIIDLMRHWYNGYGFSREKNTVYNPFSTLLFLDSGEINNYWFQTATPTLLIDQIKKQTYPIDRISGVLVGDTTFNSHDLEKINLISLMWQTGYLTIKNYDPSKRLYYLDYPNEEVKVSFLEYLAEGMTGVSIPEVSGYARDLTLSLQQYDLKDFFEKLTTFFANIPYDMHVSKEKYYQTVFYVIAKLIGLEAQLEVKTNVGRIDMVVITDKLIYIFEFKIDASAKAALDQIRDKSYFQPYLNQNKKLILVGVNFDTKKGNISEWEEATL